MPDLVNVPDVDGVPTVAFALDAAADIVLAAADAVGFPLPGAPSQWGLYRGGEQVIQADTVLGVEYKEDWVIADYPIERGGFESYNKVATPFDVRLIFAAGGSEANRTELLDSIASIIDDLELYDVVTPTAIYPNVNVIHYDYRRTTTVGLGMLVVSLYCQEVRQAASGSEGGDDPSASGETGDTADASGADQENGGTVQARDATPGEGAAATGTNAGTTTGEVGELQVEGQPGANVPASPGFDPNVNPTTGLPKTTGNISGNTPAGPG